MFKKLRSILPRRLHHSRLWDKPHQESQQRLAFDQKIVWQQTKQRSLPNHRQLKYISSFFSIREQLVIFLAGLAAFISIASIIFFTYAHFFNSIPAKGGIYREALVGIPLYLNPILANNNDIDLDLTGLIFSGLLRYDKSQELQTDLASSWEISEDEKTYTLTLRDDVLWHDGQPVTIEDVIFTYRAIQEPAVNSPLQLSLHNVKIEDVDDKTLRFTLEEPFTPFVSLLTVGIIPQHLWGNIPYNNIRLAELNIKPIGSGAWQFDKLEKDKQGNIKTYSLIPSPNYHNSQPYIEKLSFRFYPDFGSAIEALNNQKVDGISFVPRQLIGNITKGLSYQTHNLQLPQYTAVFFNQEKNSLLKDKKIRQALAYSIDRKHLLSDSLDNLGQLINGPLLPGMVGYNPENQGFPYNPIEAQRLLEEAGWKAITAEEFIEHEKVNNPDNKNPVDTGNQAVFRKKSNSNGEDEILTIKLTSVDQTENVRAAEIVRNAWQTIGFKVELDIITVDMLINSVLPSFDYQALLYGQILNVFPDLYTFWHSSQIGYPGLNLARFDNSEADELLEQARSTSDTVKQAEYYSKFEILLDKEQPAIFLYSPKYTYLLSSKIKGIDVSRISIPANRLSNINEWYIKTKRILKR